MKKFIALALLLTMCLALFAGCGEEESKPQYDPEGAAEYLLDMFPYSTRKNPVLFIENLDVPTSVAYKGEDYDVQWTVKVTSGPEDSVLIFHETGSTQAQLRLSAQVEEEIAFTVTATVTAPDSEETTVSLYYYVEKADTTDLSELEGDELAFDVNEPVTITYTHTMGKALQNVLDKYIKKFNEIYPNIHIEHTSAGGWHDISGQINTEIASGTQPNIAYCYPDHVAMYNLVKSVVTLDNLIASDKPVGNTGEIIGLTQAQKDDLIESFYNEGMVYGDDKMYTMPMSRSAEVMYYDKTFFEANGLSVPTTWDELWAVCEQIKAIDPSCIPLGYDAEANWFINLCEQMDTDYTSATGDKYLFNNAENKAFVKTLREKYQAGLFTTQELYGMYTSSLFTNQDPGAVRCYISISSSGGSPFYMSNANTADGTFAFEVGVAAIPQHSNDNRKVISQGPSLCILQGSNTSDQQILASWLFVKFLCTDVAFQAEFSMYSGYMPVLKSVISDANYASWLAKANGYDSLTPAVVRLGIEGQNDYFVPPAFAGSSVARDQVGALLVKCVSAANDAQIDDAFEDAISECEYYG